MADFTEVADALVALIATAMYPSGTSQPSMAPNAAPVMVYQGWPVPAQLDADMSAGKVHVSVWPTPSERETETITPEWQVTAVAAPTFAFAVSGNVVTVSGGGGAGQNAVLLVDGLPYAYPVQSNDTPTSIAAALATLVNAVRPASSAGPVITFAAPVRIVARVGVTGTMIRKLSQQERVFQVSVWAPAQPPREAVAKIVEPLLKGTARVTLPDGSQGIIRVHGSVQQDELQKTGIWRRDILTAVEYATTDTVNATQVTVEQTNVTLQNQIAPIDGTQPIGQITNYS